LASSSSTNLRRAAVVGLIAVAIVVAAVVRPDPAQLCVLLERAADGGSSLGVGAFLAIYAVGALLALPASWFQGAAAFLYGPVAGIPLAWAASTAFSAGTLVPVLVWGSIGAQLTDLAAIASGEATGPGWTRFAILGVTLGASAGVVWFVRNALAQPASPPRVAGANPSLRRGRTAA
jgi:hypothetical protein